MHSRGLRSAEAHGPTRRHGAPRLLAGSPFCVSALLLLASLPHLVRSTASPPSPASPSPPSPSPTPAPPTPTVFTVPSAPLPAGVDLSKFMADGVGYIYLVNTSVSLNVINAGGQGCEYTCVLTLGLWRVDPATGKVVKTFKDTATIVRSRNCWHNNYYYFPPSCTGTYTAAAVGYAGSHFFYAATNLFYENYLAHNVLVVRQVNLATGAASTLLSANLTNSTWQASVAPAVPESTRQCMGRYWYPTDAFLTGNSAPTTLVLFGTTSGACFGAPAEGPTAPLVLRLDVASKRVAIKPAGLGVFFWQVAYDDASEDLFLFHGANEPYANPPIYQQYVVRASSGRGTDVAAVKFVLPLLYNSYAYAGSLLVAVNRWAVANGTAPPPAQLYFAEASACRIVRVDSETGAVTVVAGYAPAGYGSDAVGLLARPSTLLGGTGPTRPLCSQLPVDGPATGVPMGLPTRLVRGPPGTLFFYEGNTAFLPAGRVRRLTGV